MMPSNPYNDKGRYKEAITDSISSTSKFISLTLDPGGPGGPVGPPSPSSPKGPLRPLDPCFPGGPGGPCTQTQQVTE